MSTESSGDQGRNQQKRVAPEEDQATAKRARQEDVCNPHPAPLYLFATGTDVQARRNATRDHWSRKQCLTLREMLGMVDYSDDSTSMGPIDYIFISNYIVNFEFLLDEVPELLSLPRACVIYGAKEGSENAWRQASTSADGSCTVDFVCRNPSDAPKSATNPLSQRIPYGVHHSKLFLVGYSSGILRVVIHTANLRYSDVTNKAQGAYIQDFSRKPTSPDSIVVPSDFEDCLVNYIESYQYTKSFKWDDHDPNGTVVPLAEQLRKYDFSPALAVLIPSIPGYHKLNQKHKLGHLKLRQEVARIRQGEANRKQPMAGPIICQFSSIGSLTLKYLHRLAYSMDVARARAGTGGGDSSEDDESKPLKLQLIYPTSDEICNSMEGYRGGNSVPGNLKNVSKSFLNSLWHRWSVQKSFLSSLALTREDDEATSNPLWKGTNVPHIKTYFQLTNDTEEGMEWFLLTSHNLSKAAWGDVQNSTKHNEKRLFCRHWELGVFFSPGKLHARRIVPWSPGKESRKAGDVTVPLPYRHKPVPYGESDKPWAVDQRYVRLDILGRRCASDA